MLIIVATSLIFINENRRLIEIYPERWRKLWDVWELRATVLLSLTLQVLLIVLGNRRKYNTRNWIRFILWLAYQLADWAATFSLGILSSSNANSKNDSLDHKYVIMAFWAPFLLVHLGGPDTITAYSMEDNELWPRHLLVLIFQFRVAFFVFLSSWIGTPLNFLAILIFVAGIIKYGERIWALRSASSDQLRDSMLPQPDPGPSYAKLMDEYTSKKRAGYKVELGTEIKDPPVISQYPTAVLNNIVPDAAILHDAFCFFNIFKRLFADLILSFQDIKSSQSFFQDQGMTWEKAFKVIEVELGFMYDVLYTKAALITSWFGVILRLLSLSSTIFAFVAFLVIDKHAYSLADVSITCLLLAGATALEMYAIVILLSSDCIMLWVSKQKIPLVALMYQTISCFRSCYVLPLNKRWSDSMAKYNLISFCLEDKPAKCIIIQKLLSIHHFSEKHLFKDLDTVSPDLKNLIFEELLKKSRMASDIRVCKQLCAYRGDQVLREMGCFDEFGWSVEAEFDQSILLWHIATDLCYYDQRNNSNIVENSKCKTSKSISDYMLYLLVKCPFMLPDGIGQIRFQDTCAEAIECFRERKNISGSIQACTMLLKVNTEIPPSELKGDRSKSVLFDACILAKSLQSLETKRQWTNEQKWDIICHVWVEMLSYAGSQCRWDHHAKQLRRGGELLTHVWLLMAHLGITEKFQISQGHARAKFIAS